MRGPEQVFRLALARPAANIGVAVLSGGVEPRIVRGGDENRVAGVTALPQSTNPYYRRFGAHTPIAGVLYPAAGAYDIVFDSHAARGSRFTFRVWIDDRTPPTARIVSRTASGGSVVFRVADRGSGVDRGSAVASVGSDRLPVSMRRTVARVRVSSLRRGTHALVFQISDRQEPKNDENVAGVLPNTRRVRVTVRVP